MSDHAFGSQAATASERLRDNAEHALRFTADGKSVSVWAEDALTVLAQAEQAEQRAERLEATLRELLIPQQRLRIDQGRGLTEYVRAALVEETHD